MDFKFHEGWSNIHFDLFCFVSPTLTMIRNKYLSNKMWMNEWMNEYPNVIGKCYWKVISVCLFGNLLMYSIRDSFKENHLLIITRAEENK